MSEFEKLLTSYQNRINSKLESLLPYDDSILSEAIRYSVLGGGKRLRPILVYLIGELGNAENCLLYTSPRPRDKRQSRMPSSA